MIYLDQAEPSAAVDDEASEAMSQVAAPGTKSTSVISLDKVEALCVGFFLLNQGLGLFFPPEAFFLDPAAYSLGNTQSMPARPFPMTSIISHMVEALVILLICRHWRSYFGLIGRAVPVFAQVAMFSLTSFWSVGPTESLRTSLHLFIFYIFALELVRTYTVMVLIRLLVRLFAIVALASFVVLLVFPALGHDTDMVNNWRGAVVTKNNLGATCSVGVLAAGYSILVGANDRRFALLVLVANLVLVAGSRSATSLIASAACLAVLIGLYLPSRAGGKLLLFVCGLGASCLLAAALLSVRHPADLLGKTGTLTGRTGVWQAVEPLIRDRFMTGYGIGFWSADTDFRNDIWVFVGWQPPHAHNDLLDVVLQTGAIGAFFFVFNYAVSLCLGFRRWWRFEDGYLFCVLVCLNFIIRGIAETVSLPPGDIGVTLLYAAEIYLWKLSFPGKASLSAEMTGTVSNQPRPYSIQPVVP